MKSSLDHVGSVSTWAPRLSLSQKTLAALTAFTMTLPLWTHYVLIDLSILNNQRLYVGSFLVILLPIFLLFRNVTLNDTIIHGVVAFLLVLLIPLLLSMAFNIDAYSRSDIMTISVRMTALVFFVVLISLVEMHAQSRDLLHGILSLMAWFLAFLFLYASSVTPVWHWGRFSPNDMQPNWWGEILFLVVFGAAFTSRLLLRYALWTLALVGLFLVQSRGSLLAALLLMTIVTLPTIRSRTVIVIGVICTLAVTLAVTLDVFAFEMRLISAVQDFVANRVLLLNDPYRGLGTGASGRDIGVEYGLEIFAKHPVAGVGFGRSESLASEVDESIHNGYVMLLADLGAPLFAIPAIVMIGALWLSFARKDWNSLGLIVGFMFGLLLVAPRAINMSLPTVLFWAFVARSWILPMRRRYHH